MKDYYILFGICFYIFVLGKVLVAIIPGNEIVTALLFLRSRLQASDQKERDGRLMLSIRTVSFPRITNISLFNSAISLTYLFPIRTRGSATP